MEKGGKFLKYTHGRAYFEFRMHVRTIEIDLANFLAVL